MTSELNDNLLKDSIDTFISSDIADVKPTILIVDDEINNLQLLKRTFRGSYNILTASNGVEGLEVVKQEGDRISLIVSDQKMPVMEGTEFLKKVNETHPEIVKILLTGHQDSDIIVSAINDCQLYQYILKPFDPEELKVSVTNGLKKFELATRKTLIMKDLKELFYKTIKSISCALDAKDPYTHGHSLRVTLYSLILASKLGLTDSALEEIETAGLLHDIGKIGIPQSILCKTSKLTDEEFEIMKDHTGQGAKMIQNVKKLRAVASWLKSHHERWDGRGYPCGLKGTEIPLFARVIALADTYDAMTSTRPYRKALPHEVAIQEIKRCSGVQFDPELAEIFIANEAEIKAAKENPEEYYNKLSFLQKYINTASEVLHLAQ
ncbi:MAG: HD domain-containing phosphohydrolase [Candidatus Gastranaerophilaceae bacterium]